VILLDEWHVTVEVADDVPADDAGQVLRAVEADLRMWAEALQQALDPPVGRIRLTISR
jgi:hypothetical protein